MLKRFIGNKITVRIMLVTCFFIVLFFSLCGEKVTYNDGAGWDGVSYREMAKSFSDGISTDVYNKYRIQRVAPFALLNTIYNAFEIEKNNANLQVGITVMNFLTAVIIVIIFFIISNKLKLGLQLETIAFASIFYNFPMLKLIGYYPYLTDIFALALSMVMFLCFISKKKWLVFIIGIVGSFVWPTLFLMSLCLAFLPTTGFMPVVSVTEGTLCNRYWKIFRIFMVISIIGLYLVLGYAGKLKNNLNLFYYIHEQNLLYCAIIILSVLALSYYCYMIIKPINIHPIQMIKKFLSSWSLQNIILFFGMLVLQSAIISWLSNGENGFTVTKLVTSTMGRAVKYPFVFIEAHFAYYGLPFLLIIMFWKKLLNVFGEMGFGFFIALLPAVILSVNPESRALIYVLPFFYFPLFSLFKNIKLKTYIPYIFAIFQLLFSRFWYRINVDGIVEAFEREYSTFTEFPAQRYYMNMGPWQSAEIYILFAFTALFVYFLIWYLIRRNKIIAN